MPGYWLLWATLTRGDFHPLLPRFFFPRFFYSFFPSSICSARQTLRGDIYKGTFLMSCPVIPVKRLDVSGQPPFSRIITRCLLPPGRTRKSKLKRKCDNIVLQGYLLERYGKSQDPSAVVCTVWRHQHQFLQPRPKDWFWSRWRLNPPFADIRTKVAFGAFVWVRADSLVRSLEKRGW